MKYTGSKILLSFDVEEFDIPLEYGIRISKEEQFNVGLQGLERVSSIIEKYNIRVTFFVTASFALRYPEKIRMLAAKHEIASHGFTHTGFADGDLEKSRKILEEITGTGVIGFRSPRMKKFPDKLLIDAGYKYNSSENPTYIPGRYNNFFSPKTIYKTSDGLISVPASVSPLIRFPLFWLSFKNIPFHAFNFLASWTLWNDSCLNLYFHPWEFTDLTAYKLPTFIKRVHGQKHLNRLEMLIISLKKKAVFTTLGDYTETHSKKP